MGHPKGPKLASQLATLVRRAQVPHEVKDPVRHLAAQLGGGPLDLVILFVTPAADIDALAADAASAFDRATVIGCTTAGEIGAQGYTDEEIVAIGLPAGHFSTETLLFEDIGALDRKELTDRALRARGRLASDAPLWTHEFAFLLIDGLAMREDDLTDALSIGLGPVPLFGGSAGDGTRFEQTFLIHDGTVYRDAAVLTVVRTDCPVKVFKLDHLEPSTERMVVTDADPSNRVVREINAEPAAREYARILGKDPDQLTTFTFAAHPLVVRIGGQHHVRANQRVAEHGDQVFFSALDEGLVLTLAEAKNINSHLETELTALSERETPEVILACDCILRRMEAQENQAITALSRTLAAHNVVGFNTYGEQLNGMHVNQTLTGVAIYPPDLEERHDRHVDQPD